MAAGNSTRMGRCKFLLTLQNGNSLLENILQQAEGFGFKKTIVVIQPENFESFKNKCANGRYAGVTFVMNSNPEFERFYSLKLGFEALGEDVDACFIHNADNPFLTPATLTALFEKRNISDVVCPRYGDKNGHPVLINKNTISYLRTCPDNSVLNIELQKRSKFIVGVNDELICADIDTPNDYKKLVAGEKHL